MQEQDLARIESIRHIELPERYRAFMLNYPDRLLQTEGSRVELLSELADLLQINEEVDAIHINGWEGSFFAIGVSGCGDYYAIDVNEDDCEVYFWNHEIDEIDESSGSPSIEEFAGSLLSMYTRLQSSKWKFWAK